MPQTAQARPARYSTYGATPSEHTIQSALDEGLSYAALNFKVVGQALTKVRKPLEQAARGQKKEFSTSEMKDVLELVYSADLLRQNWLNTISRLSPSEAIATHSERARKRIARLDTIYDSSIRGITLPAIKLIISGEKPRSVHILFEMYHSFVTANRDLTRLIRSKNKD